ncbi:MAG: hypothetical protein JNM88_07955 [Chitinophagaceae bacterium]|nr:hypothetical protein [Chitinophagaceae bacterium]
MAWKGGTIMGMTKLNIYVSAMDNPCGIDQRTWYVTIYDCDGNVLQYCGRKYVVMPARCGHLEVEVPPGIYYIKAVWSFRLLGGIYYVNHFTDAAIVQACCGDHVCVKLFNPSIHRCGTILVRAMYDVALQKGIKPQEAKAVEQAVNAALEKVPKPEKQFELAHLDEIEKLVREQEAKIKG